MTAPSERAAFFHEQIEVCALLAEQKPRNYHAWSFRHWVVSQLTTHEELYEELERMHKWCKSHIIDHSGWNHRQHTLNQLLRQYPASMRSQRQSLVLAEHAMVSTIMARYPTHEALWCHRRCVVQLMLREASGQLSSEDNDVSEHELCSHIQDFEAQVRSGARLSSVNADGEHDGVVHEYLHESWGAIRADLDDSDEAVRRHWSSAAVALACIREVEVAWACDSRHAQRYAVWCLERLKQWTHNVVLRAAATSLSSSCRRELMTKDLLLENLWSSSTA